MRCSDTDSTPGAINRFGDWILGKLGLNTGSTPTSNWIGVNAAPTADTLAQVMVATGADTNKGVVVQCNSATQSASLMEFQSNSGTVLASVSSAGTVNAPNVQINAQLRLSATTLSLAGSPVTATGNPVMRITSMTAAAQTVKMPASPVTGQVNVVLDETGVPTGTNTVTFQTNSGGTVLGTNTMTTAFGAHLLYWNGTNWYGYRLF